MTTAVANPRTGGDGALTAVAAAARQVAKAYGSGETRVVALDAVDVDIARGRFTAIMGPSGSGKSTLMHCLAGLDTVTEGRDLDRRAGDHRPEGQEAHPAAPGPDRLHLPGVQPAAHAQRDRRTSRCRWTSPAASPTRRGWTASSRPSASPTASSTAPPSSPAASSSASPSPAPSPPARRSSSATSPPETSTRAPAPRSSASCAAPWTSSARPSSWSPTTRSPPPTPTACSTSPTAASSTRWPARPPSRSWTGCGAS